MTVTVTALSITPVKGTRIRRVDAVTLDGDGARGDRTFYIVDASAGSSTASGSASCRRCSPTTTSPVSGYRCGCPMGRGIRAGRPRG